MRRKIGAGSGKILPYPQAGQQSRIAGKTVCCKRAAGFAGNRPAIECRFFHYREVSACIPSGF